MPSNLVIFHAVFIERNASLVPSPVGLVWMFSLQSERERDEVECRGPQYQMSRPRVVPDRGTGARGGCTLSWVEEHDEESGSQLSTLISHLPSPPPSPASSPALTRSVRLLSSPSGATHANPSINAPPDQTRVPALFLFRARLPFLRCQSRRPPASKTSPRPPLRHTPTSKNIAMLDDGKPSITLPSGEYRRHGSYLAFLESVSKTLTNGRRVVSPAFAFLSFRHRLVTVFPSPFLSPSCIRRSPAVVIPP
jgi:hypothetical protein